MASTACNTQVIKLSLPINSRRSSNLNSSIQQIDNKFMNLQEIPISNRLNSPDLAKKIVAKVSITRSPIMLRSPGSTATTATVKKRLSVSPKKTGNQTTLSIASPVSTKDKTFSRMHTIALDGTVCTPSNTKGLKSPTNKNNQSQVETPAQPEKKPLTEEEINEKMHKVFQFYACFGERVNVGYLKSHRFTKMMVDAEVRTEEFNQSSLDLLFAGELRHSGNLDFGKFMNLLKRVAKVKFENRTLNQNEAFEIIILEHMFPLYERLFTDEEIVFEDETKVTAAEPLEKTTVMMFDAVDPGLEKIFKTYFSWDIQTGNDKKATRQKMENALFIFLREFGICPNLLSKGEAFALWTNVMKEELVIPQEQSSLEESIAEDKPKPKKKKNKQSEKEKNLPFNFDRFKTFLVRMGQMAFQSQAPQNLNQSVHPSGAKDTEPQMIKPVQMEKTLLLLERMDIAYRTVAPEKKANVAGGSPASLLVPQKAVDKIKKFIRKQTEEFGSSLKASIQAAQVQAQNQANVTGIPVKKVPTVLILSGTNYEKYNIEEDEVIFHFEKHHHALMKIFHYYCSYGEPLNTTRLHAFKFTKFLREAGLLTAQAYPDPSFKILEGVQPTTEASLTIADADIIVASLSGPKQVREQNELNMSYDPEIVTPWLGFFSYLYTNNPLNMSVQGRLEFEAFLKAIEIVAAKLLPNAKTLGKGVAQLLEKNILKLEKEIEQVQKAVGSIPLKVLVDLLQDMEMVEFLGVVHKSMMLYYKHYSDSKGMMNIEKFMQFCREFGIFPDLITKGKLITFFHALAGVRKQAEGTEVLQTVADSDDGERAKRLRNKKAIEQQEDDLVDQHMFIEALALIALDIPYLNPQPSEKEKIINLLEKMNQSQGVLNVRLKMGVTRTNNGASWDIMVDLRNKYPELFAYPEEEEHMNDDKVEEMLQQSLRK